MDVVGEQGIDRVLVQSWIQGDDGGGGERKWQFSEQENVKLKNVGQASFLNFPLEIS